MKRFKSIKFLFFTFFLCFMFGMNDKVVYGEQIDYSVKAIIPENQSDKEVTYFDLKVTPNQKQILNLEVSNNSDRTITLVAEVNNAITNQNGIIDYSKHNYKKDSSLKIALEDIVKNSKQEIVLKPKEIKKIGFNLEVPTINFDGIVLGAIRFSEKENQNKADEKSNVQIKNKYAYTMGILLRENDKLVEPELHLLSAQPELMNYRQVITGTIQNNMPVILRDLELDATVTPKGSKEIYVQYNQKNMKMAPNSQFNFPIPLNGREFKPGKYILNMTGSTSDKKYTWSFSKEFTIKNDDAKKLNNEAVPTIKEKEIPTWVYVIATLAIIIILVWVLKVSRDIYYRKSSKSKK